MLQRLGPDADQGAIFTGDEQVNAPLHGQLVGGTPESGATRRQVQQEIFGERVAPDVTPQSSELFVAAFVAP
jgi:hypothetical protein